MKIDLATRGELAQLKFNHNTATIQRQLDRKEYKLVNDVLVACGGKWNKKLKAHVFDGDAADAMDAAITTGQVVKASEMGFFPTNSIVARDLVDWTVDHTIAGAAKDLSILEPSAGNGAIAIWASKHGPTLAIEVDDRHRVSLETIREKSPLLTVRIGDFFNEPLEANFTHIIGNPPFAKTLGHDAIDHFCRACALLAAGGVIGMVMPESICWREDRRHLAFRRIIRDSGGVIEALPDDSFKHAGTSVRTVRVKLRRVWGLGASRDDAFLAALRSTVHNERSLP